MATEYRVSNTPGMAWGDMTPTTLLDDGSPGDTGTGESDQKEDTSLNVCRYLEAMPELIAQVRLGTVHSVTGVSLRITLTNALQAP